MAEASQSPNPAASNDMDFYVENLIFSFVPVTSLIAARYGQKAWTTWETLLSVAAAATLALRSELALPIIVLSSLIISSPNEVVLINQASFSFFFLR